MEQSQTTKTPSQTNKCFFHLVFFFAIKFLFFLRVAIKRSDSIRSKRKVLSISDRSDVSDVPMDHDISGEKIPGILSDDLPPESLCEFFVIISDWTYSIQHLFGVAFLSRHSRAHLHVKTRARLSSFFSPNRLLNSHE